MVSINKLAFGYKKSPLLFSDLDMELNKGAVYGLFGRNGAGKTTLLKLIAGLLFPGKGTCLVNGSSSGLRLPQGLDDFYMVPEEFDLPPVTVRTYTGLHAPFYTGFDHDKMEYYLGELDIDPERSLHHLSYGQKKKFLIAFGLASQVSLLLLDEPTNGLDIPSKSQFRRIMAATASDDRCILISTHQVRDLGNIIDNITILEEGRIVFDKSSGVIADRLSFRKIADQQGAGPAAEPPREAKSEPEREAPAQKETDQPDKMAPERGTPEQTDKMAPERGTPEQPGAGSHEGDILYSEEIFGGRQIIARRKPGESDTEMDLELLFNAVIERPDIINHACRQGGDHE